MPIAPRVYIYALEAGFSQVCKNCQVFCQTVGGVFLTFLPKIKDGNSIGQTAGDALKLVNWELDGKLEMVSLSGFGKTTGLVIVA